MGANGWSKVVRDGSPAADANQLLSEKYVCVYVDVTTKSGKTLAKNFEITGDVGMVISDRTGSMQAFWNQGDMTNQIFVSTLQKYSDAQRVVRTTETGTIVRTSNYPSMTSEGGAGLTLPGQSSYCPTCNNGGGSGRRR